MILERDNHIELIALNGKYSAMWKKQQKHGEVDSQF